MGNKKRKRKSSNRKRIRGLGSLIRILFVAAVCFGAIYYAMYHEDSIVPVFNKSEEVKKTDTTESAGEQSAELAKDPLFEPCYVMISNATDNGIKTTATPADNGTIVKRLKNGTIVQAVENGTNSAGISYFKLEDGSYLLDEDEYVLELKSYTKIKGYVVITFVSATGVKLRAWANFDDDNVAKRVFVGDQVQIVGKVVTQDDQEAYETSDGYYMTTNPEYFDAYLEEVPEGYVEEGVQPSQEETDGNEESENDY